ncbi:MAG: hypothetical protein QM767_17005 [Anaeromyxobacter sp.]
MSTSSTERSGGRGAGSAGSDTAGAFHPAKRRRTSFSDCSSGSVPTTTTMAWAGW